MELMGWTDDFQKFRKKIESHFGKLEVLAEKAPDVYVHMVLSSGFMEYAAVKGLNDSIESRIKTEQGSFNPQNPEHNRLCLQYLKTEYLKWARQNNLPEQLLESGWEEYLED